MNTQKMLVKSLYQSCYQAPDYLESSLLVGSS